MSVFVVLDEESVNQIQGIMREYRLPELASHTNENGERGLFMGEDLLADALSFVGRIEASRCQLPRYADVVQVNTMPRQAGIPDGVYLRGWSVVDLHNAISPLTVLMGELKEHGFEHLVIATTDEASLSCMAQDNIFCVFFGYAEAFPIGTLPLEYNGDEPSVFLHSKNCIGFVNIPECLNEDTVTAIRRCVSAVVGGIAASDYQQFCAKLELIVQERASQLLMSRLWTNVDSEIELMKSRLATKQSEYDVALVRLAECRQELMLAQATLQSQATFLAERRRAAADELHAARQIPKVIDVVVSTGCISIYTDHLVALDPRTGKYHAIGKFRIDLYPDEKVDDSKVARWHNLTRSERVGDELFIAPHIKATGLPCFGGFIKSLPPAIREYRLYSAVTLAISIVERVDVGDRWGRNVHCFPEAEVDMVDGIAYFKHLIAE
jgi:hypothetical protein